MSDYQRSLGVQWHVTNVCDQRCEHCYIYRGGTHAPSQREMSLSEDIACVDDLIDSARRLDCALHLSITGGDPLLFTGIWKLLEYLDKKHIRFSILGNPFHLSPSVCRRLKLLGCKSYQMSLDGLQNTHDTIRKSGSFQTTLQAIAMIRDAKIKSTIMSTVSRSNFEELPDLARIVVKHHADTFAFARYCPTDNDKDLMLTAFEYRDFLSKMWNVYTELAQEGTAFTLKDHLWTLFLSEKGLLPIESEDVIIGGCNCGFRHVTILPNGIVYACRRFESPIGDIRTQTMYDIFLSPELEKYRQIEKMNGCNTCELLMHCRGCHAVSHGFTGDFFSKDPQCWKKNPQ